MSGRDRDRGRESGGELVYGIHPVREGLQGRRRQPLELILQQDGHNPRQDELRQLAAQVRVPLSERSREELDRLAGHRHHQGALLRLAPFAYSDFDALLQRCRQAATPPLLLLLDGITDPHNFGALLRNAEAAGCQGVIVPKDRAAPVTAVVDKTSAGALEHILLCQVTNLSRCLEELKQAGLWIYGLAGEAEATELYASDLRGPVALVVGSEGKGLRPNVRRHCDGLLAIPMQGRVGSLNASAAAAVALFEVVRQRRES